jgi:RNA polymerase sigma-70 factor, ECF subfamily
MEILKTCLEPPVATDEDGPIGRPTAGEPASEAETSFELLNRARTGDEAARNHLCARYLPRLQRWAHGRLPVSAREAGDTLDLVQNTLIRVLQNLPTFVPRHAGSFPAYVHLALRNQLLDMIRRANRRPAYDQLDADKSDHAPSPLDVAIGQETRERYEAACARLTPKQQVLIVLHIEMGYAHQEVADELGLPTAAAAAMAVRRALVRLAEEMSHDRA